MISEKKLVLELTRFLDPDAKKLICLIDQSKDFAYVLGQLAINRVAGVAYYVLQKTQLLSKFNREFRTSLKSLYEMNCIQNISFHSGLIELADCFQETDFPYAFLKGAFLSETLYPRGLRTSHDYDILIEQKDISACEKILLDHGFVQGKCIDGKGIVPAGRKEIVSSRMNRGETVPFVKLSDRLGSEVIEVDINFSLDFKAKHNADTVSVLLREASPFKVGAERKLYTLASVDFLIHLCAHLFKEATNYKWVEMGRDLSLYKFLDIYTFLHRYSFICKDDFSDFCQKIISRIQQLGLEKECYYALFHTAQIYPDLMKNRAINNLLNNMEVQSYEDLNRVQDPANKKVYEYETDLIERFFSCDRTAMLKEVVV